MHYPACIGQSNNSSYTISFPDVPGCVAAGDSFEQALRNGKEALEFHFEGMALDGDEIPLPASIDDHKSDPDYEGLVWALVEVDISQYLGKAVKLNITLPQFLLSRIDKEVQHSPDYRSRSGFLAEVALKALGEPLNQ